MSRGGSRRAGGTKRTVYGRRIVRVELGHDLHVTRLLKIASSLRRFVGDPAIRAVLAAFVVGRMVVVASAAIAESQRGVSVATAISSTGSRVLWTDTPILSSLTSWDGVNYLLLAAGGYGGSPTNGPYPLSVFFPAYPASIAATRAVAGDGALAAVLISNVAFVSALLVVLGLGRLVVSEQQARLGAVFLALAAGGTAFSMAYTESLFLLVSATSLLAAERGRAALAGALFAAAAVTRVPGIALGLPLLMILWRTAPDRRAALAWLTLGPLAVVGFLVYLGTVGVDPLEPLRGQAAWDPAYRGALQGIVDLPVSGSQIALLANPLLLRVAFVSLFALTAVAGIRAHRAAVGLPYAVLILIAVLSVLASGRLMSADRYLAVAFPVGWVIAGTRHSARIAWVLFSIAILAVTSYLSFSFVLLP
jgi:hypothetical protein